MKFSRLLTVAGAAIAMAGGASSAMAKSIAYYNFPLVGTAQLVDWQTKKRARVVTSLGARMGQVADNGSQKLITLDQPYSSLLSWGNDGCGDFEERHLVKQMVVRDLPGGVSQLVDIGEDLMVGGCQNGQSIPFGSPDDAGLSTKRLAMTARPSMADLVTGVQIAGPGEEAWLADDFNPAQGVVTVQTGAAIFQATGHTYPTSISADGWWVFNLPSGQRAHTRLATDAKTGGEVWLIAEWAAGVPQRVAGVNFVKPVAGAGFGTMTQASRMWQSGFTIGTNTPFFHYLYKNGTGERVLKNLDTGEEFRYPITSWGLDGLDLWEQRLFTDGVTAQNRRWVPLRNQGTKTRWVMETYDLVQDGVTTPLIKPRVVYYVDTGKAVPPAAR